MKIFKYDVTDSTNERARVYAKNSDAEFPAVFIAKGQTAGRGRRGRSFDSEYGAGLYISFLFKPEADMSDPAKITAGAAVALARAILKATKLAVGIKWVNDIFVSNRKLAGILTEGEFDAESGALSYAVCGIGVNLLSREFPSELRDIVVTLEDAIGCAPDADLLTECLIDEFFKIDNRFIDEYRTLSTVKGKRVAVHRVSGEEFFAEVVDITDGAALLVRREDGTLEELISAEVSIRQ